MHRGVCGFECDYVDMNLSVSLCVCVVGVYFVFPLTQSAATCTVLVVHMVIYIKHCVQHYYQSGKPHLPNSD